MITSNKKQELEDLSCLPQVSQSHPWLVMCGGKDRETQTFFSISKDRYYTRNIPEMANKRILFNCKEWLVLVDYDIMEYSLLNIISMKKIELPRYDGMFCTLFCNLTCPPEDPNCRVVFIDHMDKDICICQPGDDKFVNGKIQVVEGNTFSNATCFDENIYVVLHPSRSLIRANLSDPTLEFQIVINGESARKELLDISTLDYLIKSCGELLLVSVSCWNKESRVFQVFLADFDTSKWVLLQSIGDRAIFLDAFAHHGISCSSSDGGIQGNCVYYTEENKRSLYVFNFEDKSFRMSIPCPTISLINLTQHWLMIPSTNVPFD